MIERFGQRMADFVGSTGLKALHAIEEVAPGLEPPRHRVLTPGRALLAAGGAVVAGVASSALRNVAPDGTKTEEKAADLADRTRAELYELAQKADIEGRSAMTKDELVRALKKVKP